MDEKEDQRVESEESNQSLSILDIPFLPLVKIFTYLPIHDLRSCALTCRYFSHMAQQPSLWKDLYPIHWTYGCSKGSDLLLPSMRKKQKYRGTIPKLMNRRWQVGLHMQVSWLWEIVEYHLLSGMLEHLLPLVGHGVRELNLNDSTCLHDSMLRAMLVQCPNLSLLAVKRTTVTPAAFSRLAEYGACRRLTSLDVSLTRVNVDSLTSLVKCWEDKDEDELLSPPTMEEDPLQVYYINGDDYGAITNNNTSGLQLEQLAMAHQNISEDEIKTIHFPQISSRRRGKCPGLKVLDLSGCPLDDSALTVLKNSRLLVESLEWLDVSGCVRLTPEAISDFVLSCPKLQPENLFYCSHINGPYAKTTNGCSKLSQLSCCDKYS